MIAAEVPIADLVRGFEDTTLPKEQWTHAAHVRTALLYVVTYGEAEASARMRTNIQRYNAAVGSDASAYHETITIAWVALIARFVDARAGIAYDDLARELVDGCDKHILLRFYAKDTLMSADARARWVAPDLAPIAWPISSPRA
jgi:hypothetical protein